MMYEAVWNSSRVAVSLSADPVLWERDRWGKNYQKNQMLLKA